MTHQEQVQVNCDFCEGQGHLYCPDCAGSGANSFTYDLQCPTCFGHGQLPCIKCHGNGWIIDVILVDES